MVSPNLVSNHFQLAELQSLLCYTGSEGQHAGPSLPSPDSLCGGAASERSPWAQGIPTDTPYAQRKASPPTMHEGSSLSRSLYGGADSGDSSPSPTEQDSDGGASNSPGAKVEYSFDQPQDAQAAHDSHLKRPAAFVSAGLDELAVTSRLDSAMDQAALMGRHSRLQALREQQHGGPQVDSTARHPDSDGLLSPLSLISHGPGLEPGSAAGTLAERDASHSDEWAFPELENLAKGDRCHARTPDGSDLWPACDSGVAPEGAAPRAAGEDIWLGLDDGRLTETGNASGVEQQQEQDPDHDGGRDAWAGTAAGDALLAAMAAGADADGPIELDTFMLYSPISTADQLSNGPEPPEAATDTSPDEVRVPHSAVVHDLPHRAGTMLHRIPLVQGAWTTRMGRHSASPRGIANARDSPKQQQRASSAPRERLSPPHVTTPRFGFLLITFCILRRCCIHTAFACLITQ